MKADQITISDLMEKYDFWFYFSDLLYKAPVIWSLLMSILFLDMRETRSQEKVVVKSRKDR